MNHFSQHSDYSLVTAILPRHSTHEVLDAVMNSGAHHALTKSARGTLIKQKRFESLLPRLSPEQEILTFLVPKSETDHLMEQIVMVGKLELFGAGAIYAVPCENLICSEDYPLWKEGQYTFESISFDVKFRSGLVEIGLITDKDNGEGIARAAIRAGAPGPTISYVRGYGLRDKLGLLRITKSHDKELVSVVVDRCDVEPVFQAMASAGRVDQPGRGIIYQTPLAKGLTNLAAVFNPQKHSASIQQIIRAIDEINGGASWRDTHLLIHDPTAAEFQQNTKGYGHDLVVLHIHTLRKDTDELLQAVLRFGVPGASVSYWRYAEAEGEVTKGGLRLNREMGRITMVLEPESAENLMELLRKAIEEGELGKACIYTCKAPVVKTFSASPLAGRS